MDSRIREIEQWVAEAKTDLGECGREAYINKLFLLDAEIRAIIKDNGTLPAAASPRQQQSDKVRRFTARALVSAGAAAVLLLTASTVFLTLSGNTESNLASPPPIHFASTDSDSAAIIAAGYIPGNIPNEEILPDGWTPPVSSTPQVPLPLVAFQASGRAVSAPLPMQPAQPASTGTEAVNQPKTQTQAPAHTNDAIAVVAMVPASSIQPRESTTGGSNNASGPASYVSGGIEREVGFSWFPESDREADPVNQTKAEMGERFAEQPKEIEISEDNAVDTVDNSEVDSGTAVDGEEPELDESALRELLENTLNKRSKT
jgi:hypothetical protein